MTHIHQALILGVIVEGAGEVVMVEGAVALERDGEAWGEGMSFARVYIKCVTTLGGGWLLGDACGWLLLLL